MKFRIVLVCVFVMIGQAVSNSIPDLRDEEVNGLLRVTRLYCGTFDNDYDILETFPYHVRVNPNPVPKTYALMNPTTGRITKLVITNEPQVPYEVYCLKGLETLEITGTPFNHGTSNVALYEIPLVISNLVELRSLTIKGMSIKTLTDQLGKLTKLTSLEITNTLITEMPKDVSKLTLLNRLTISNNSLTSLPNLAPLSSLSHVDISWNPLSSVDNLYAPTTLLAAGCKLSVLPVMIVKTNLQTLDLNYNNLSQIMDIGVFSNLRSLDLIGNKIRRVPATISRLTYLGQLLLSENLISDLPTDVYQLRQLRKLDISNNNMSPTEISEIKRLVTVMPSRPTLII